MENKEGMSYLRQNNFQEGTWTVTIEPVESDPSSVDTKNSVPNRKITQRITIKREYTPMQKTFGIIFCSVFLMVFFGILLTGIFMFFKHF